MQTRGALEQLDQRLANLARHEGALRLRLGQLLEALARGDISGARGFAELGFPTISAYSLERCERSPRWTEGARCLARRLELLPRTRVALARGLLSWSMAELIARIATPSNEAEWLARTDQASVREMRGRVATELGQSQEREATDVADEEEKVTLTLRVDAEDAWLWRATRSFMETWLDTLGSEEQASALLAETMSTLANALPKNAVDWEALSGNCPGGDDSRAAEWRAQLAAWRTEAEERCEPAVLQHAAQRPPGRIEHDEMAMQAALGGEPLRGLPPHALDREIREVARQLATRDLELASGLLELHEANGWRRLGYASEQQYARERLGVSRSLVMSRQALARKLAKLPAVAVALAQGRVGVEASVELARVATPATELAWLERATRRTVKDLKEEVEIAGIAVRVSGRKDCPPPSDEELEAFHALERAVLSGKLLRNEVVQPDPRDEKLAAMMEAPSVEAPVEAHPVEAVTGATPVANSAEAPVEAHPVEAVTGATPVANSAEAAPVANSAEAAPVANAAIEEPVANAGETAPVANAGETAPVASDAEPEPVQLSAGAAGGRAAAGARAAWHEAAASLSAWLARGIQTPTRPLRGPVSTRSAGRVEVRLRMSRGTYALWRALEKEVRRTLRIRTSFLKFLCLVVWEEERHLLSGAPAFAVRDLGRCANPVCRGRHLQGHHIVFRSQAAETTLRTSSHSASCVTFAASMRGGSRPAPSGTGSAGCSAGSPCS